MFFYTKNTHKLCTFSTSDKICEAALTLFSQKGFFNTSIHNIQKKSNVSIGSIYHYFKSKEYIANNLYKNILSQMDESFIDVMSQHETFQDKYFHIIKLLFEMTEKEKRTMRFVFHSKYSEYCNSCKPIYQTTPFETIYKEITLNCDSEIMKKQMPSISLIMSSLFSLPIQLIQLRLDNIIKEPITNQTDVVNKIVWNGLCEKNSK